MEETKPTAKELAKIFVLRALRGFISGGIGACALLYSAGVSFKTLEDIKVFSVAFGLMFLSGAVTGLIQAFDKLARELKWY